MKNNSTLALGLNFALAICLVAVTGCQTKTADETKSKKSDYDGSKFVLDTEPANGQNVIAARESVKDKEEIVIVGRIGGGLNPWVEGMAAFQIVDPSLLACSDEKEDGEACSCKTPWDYCCETDKLPTAMAFVKFVEADGKLVKHDAREVFGLKELQTVVVKGVASRDDAGNLTVMANSMFIRP